MKVAIALLIVCFASTSHQVQPRAHYIPLYYADGLPAGYDIVDWAKVSIQSQTKHRDINQILIGSPNEKQRTCPEAAGQPAAVTRPAHHFDVYIN